ncbi:hypothetical protein T4A_10142 [Trichinella pseudospiralis]|uniref:Uncharacterized protein n=1 Tax=Trichinella pseudospiralis TaxID=6337 RepID=A0A0V1EGW6_TRIPS|nr:hypothetical protein T4A_10142 [Trichinella pseudospiralis]KRZ38062.1 hypothetical protein T4C_5905 [Trichinella pseudospiralis]
MGTAWLTAFSDAECGTLVHNKINIDLNGYRKFNRHACTAVAMKDHNSTREGTHTVRPRCMNTSKKSFKPVNLCSNPIAVERVNELESILDEEPLLRVSGRLERVNFRDKACVTQRSPSYKTELKSDEIIGINTKHQH